MKKVGGGVALVAATLVLVGGWAGLVGAFFPAEDIDGLALVTSDGHASLFVTESVSHYVGDDSDDLWTTRLAVYDLATGARVSRRVIQWGRSWAAQLTPLGPAPGGHWFYDTSVGLNVLDPRDGAVVRGAADLLSAEQRAHLLRTGSLQRRLAYFPDEQAAMVTLIDGSRLRVSADEASGAPFTGSAPPLVLPSLPGHATVVEVPGAGLARLDHREADPTGSVRLAEAGALFLGGFFLIASDGEPLVAADPPSVLVMHTTTLEADSPPLLSRVRIDDGSALFSTPIGAPGRLLLAHATGESVVLVRHDGGDVMLCAFGLADGAERYRVDLN